MSLPVKLLEDECKKRGWRIRIPEAQLKGIVLLLGWWFSEHKHLDKYGSYWQSKGFVVVQVPNHFIILRLGTQTLVDAAKGLYNIVRTIQIIKKLPLLVHAFSNGGLSHLYNYVQQHHDSVISAVILDSCPGDITLAGGARAVSAPISSKFMQWIVYIAFIILMSIGHVILPLLGITRFSLSNKSIGHGLLTSSPVLRAAPFLYLFGPGDRIVDYSFIKQSIENQKQAGMVVHQTEFANSGHVAHFRAHPEQYTAAIESFVADVHGK
jgi:hypothetical protein